MDRRSATKREEVDDSLAPRTIRPLLGLPLASSSIRSLTRWLSRRCEFGKPHIWVCAWMAHGAEAMATTERARVAWCGRRRAGMPKEEEEEVAVPRRLLLEEEGTTAAAAAAQVGERRGGGGLGLGKNGGDALILGG
ncbi:hypothetical protein PR202_ga20327 [Eleusine coracana subsp. coracana]|uniref:Uncharacterized protein n=1 Tax=Eleusine coracana subsp. coracana TaxID=191504 RepID=A0AAV5CYF8_ELECO|nr:hypothetical protein PR202_ga20327 [Eleusine coracana subsp. coracana]